MAVSYVREQTLLFLSNPLLTAIGVTMVVETTIEGGATDAWIVYTFLVALVYGIANHLHEGTDDMVEDLHDELHDG